MLPLQQVSSSNEDEANLCFLSDQNFEGKNISDSLLILQL